MTLVIQKPLVLSKAFTWNETVWNPSMISTALWLDAADANTVTQSSGVITSWSDKSGNNRTASAAGNPTYSATGMSTSKPAVQLDGTDDRFVSSITGINSFNALDVFIVVQSTAAAAENVNSAIFWGYGNIGSANGIYSANSALALLSSTGVLNNETIALALENINFLSGRIGSTTYSRSANTAQLLQSTFSTTGIILRSNSTTVTLDLNNSITTSSNAAPSNIGYTIDSDLHIGAFRAVGGITNSPAIKFGEFIVLSTTASTETRQRIEGYLAHKWGLAANLPSNHPYKTVGPTP